MAGPGGRYCDLYPTLWRENRRWNVGTTCLCTLQIRDYAGGSGPGREPVDELRARSHLELRVDAR
jgi:hypothetical protein